MSAPDTVTFYLHPQLRKQAERGNHNFIGKISEVLVDAGLTVAFDDDDDLARLRAITRSGRGLFLMDPPPNARGLTFRKTYIYPFWHIEKEAERWKWPVARDKFHPGSVDLRKALNFYRFWRHRLFAFLPQDARKDSFIYIPLQGQLLRKRSFQSCSPLDMIRTTLEHDTSRQVIATCHPTETYSTEEQSALQDLAAKHSRFLLTDRSVDDCLQTCDYVVTQNSSVAFKGYFFAKPAILFGKADFHHIALNIEQIGAEQAFDDILGHRPDYAVYLYWFLQLRAINAGRPEAKKKITNTLRSHGWPV